MKNGNNRLLVIDDDHDIWKAYQLVLQPEQESEASSISQLSALLMEEYQEEPEESVDGAPDFDLTYASQGQDGFEMVKQALEDEQPFAIAFVDIRMPPGWDGMKTAAHIREVDPNIEIVIVTAYSDRSREEIAQTVGTLHKLLFFRKPFDPEELMQVAVSLCEKWNIGKKESEQRRELEIINEQLKEKIATNERLQEEGLQLQQKLHQAQKMEAIGLMAGGVAHDLNNILASIVGYPQLIKFHLPEHKLLHELAQEIEEAGERAAAVVDDLLTVARGVAVVKQTVDLNMLVEDYLSSTEAKEACTRHPEVLLSSELDPQTLPISCSPIHIAKCLMNLVNNAAEAIDGEGQVVIATGRKELTEALDNPTNTIASGHYAILQVQDNGPGISEEDQERVFEPFYTKKAMGRSGTGLGLAVVWNTALDHNGLVTVRSAQGQGTIFTLLFPLVDAEISLGEKIEPGLEELSGTGTVMVVDDDVRQLNLAGGMLNVLGYEVIKASNGEEALEILAEQPVDLLVLDMIMPDMGGRQTYEEVTKLYPGQKAIISSGFAADKDVRKAQEMGAGSFVKKPYTLKQLGLAVRQELQPSDSQIEESLSVEKEQEYE
ncbi:MAG: response regulator [Candidatus Electrothrix aestuarii]|uniref:histidine kinase n=1 Tax=Candidatus Electrothrix aestuarii TaxID=3062594 RepID=A0AAU8LUG1_9BACT|nr:response regulator [Candidatus Electrothrix aestuarii]